MGPSQVPGGPSHNHWWLDFWTWLCQEENARHYQAVDQAHVPPSADSLGGAGCHYPDFQLLCGRCEKGFAGKLENLWMRAFKKAWKVNASLPDVTFWAGPEQGGLGTPKVRAIISSETISLLNQYMCLNNDLRQVTIQDMAQAIAHPGCSTIAEAQAELQWSGKDWQQHPSLCHRFLACTSRGMQIKWMTIQVICTHRYIYTFTVQFLS